MFEKSQIFFLIYFYGTLEYSNLCEIKTIKYYLSYNLFMKNKKKIVKKLMILKV